MTANNFLTILIILLWNWSDSSEGHVCLQSTNLIESWRNWDIEITTERLRESGLFNTCPSMLALGPFSPDQDRSSCPWYYVNNRDRHRLPSVIQEARCNCTRCFGTNEDSYCREQYVNVPVLFCFPLDDSQCSVRFDRISVGCSCYFPRRLENIR
ncbi:hypothetical protein LOTGIDRAFT_172928 [Lottia gigantea]|uniref:Uncharacterized protein n=1 Tax=Lottia gigantea TaxID=225164 RepID=V4CG15_LOTGI|nr:hypothetical protein LOTGIDRAFT_172928 [Lottia gigantea]ESP00995.1 hypothetical protein LOTGIDRAFT_172928 [Lottia gigantea]